MRAVPSKNTTPEVTLRKALWSEGLRGYRLHSKEAPGCPDVLFPVERIVIFVDGCFWHGCPTCHRAPKTNSKYWSMKVRRNQERDRRINDECMAEGWAVIRVWEHEVSDDAAEVARHVKRRIVALSRKRRRPRAAL
jgi:DNA mismatch endonuclease (patch repair protein)